MKLSSKFCLQLFFQIFFLIASLFLIATGLWGEQFAPKNVTTLFVWVHYRGFLVISLLLWGNFFCMSCPFVFMRNIMRVLIAPKFLWPKQFQNKWGALILFIAVLFSYEYFSLWSSPFKTAILIILLFMGALITDLLFKKASFCKYLCPIGQFNFLASTLSPKVVKAKSLPTFDACTTHDCLRGNSTQRGCELHLFIPKKVGNLDCTFCMDCVKACPHNNIVLSNTLPSEELWQETHRSGIGDISKRKDVLALIIIFTFGGLLNAFSMISAASIVKEKLHFLNNHFLILSLLFVFFLVFLPFLLIGLPNTFTKTKNQHLIHSLLPLGFSIWIAHYSFHLLTGLLTFVPLFINIQMPIKYMGLPLSVVQPIQVGFLFIGFLGSVTILVMKEKKKSLQALWICSFLSITSIALWILMMPMEMRGTFIGMNP